MSALFSTILAMVVLFLIGYPLFKGARGGSFPERTSKRSLADEKEAVMNTLGEIEFDYHMKKLSQEDYQTLKQNYAGAAVAIMKAQEEKPSKGKGKVKYNTRTIEDEIEAELQALGNKKAKPALGEACHRCGAVLKEAGQEYCHSCGERQF